MKATNLFSNERERKGGLIHKGNEYSYGLPNNPFNASFISRMCLYFCEFGKK